jgi:hypothetical protein
MTEAVEWIDAFEALKLVERNLGGRAAAKNTLSEYLRDGDLTAIAEEVWISEARTVDRAWSEKDPQIDLKNDVMLEPKMFRNSKRWRFDQADWRWPFNKFSVVTRRQPVTKRWMMKGVKFSKAEIAVIIGRAPASGVGSPGKPQEWILFWHALIRFERDQQLNQHTFPTQASLCRRMLEEIDSSLSEKTIKPVVAQVWKKFASGHLSGDDA